MLRIAAIQDRVVQGALKLIMEPIFEADFCDGSYGYRSQRTAHEAVARVAQGIVSGKTRVMDLDQTAYFDTVRPDLLRNRSCAYVRPAKAGAFRGRQSRRGRSWL